MSHMELHFAVRLLIVGVALIYVLGPILWHWHLADISTAPANVRCRGRSGQDTAVA
jgi:hypothetical protein